MTTEQPATLSYAQPNLRFFPSPLRIGVAYFLTIWLAGICSIAIYSKWLNPHSSDDSAFILLMFLGFLSIESFVLFAAATWQIFRRPAKTVMRGVLIAIIFGVIDGLLPTAAFVWGDHIRAQSTAVPIGIAILLPILLSFSVVRRVIKRVPDNLIADFE